MLNKVHTSNFRVYSEDTDFMGVIYHGNYVCFFERARTEWLRSHGISLTMMTTYDTYFAIRALHVKYHFPGRLDDQLCVTSKLISIKGCSLMIEQTMLNQDNRLLAEASVHAVMVNGQLKPIRMPQQLLKILGGSGK
jgi:acyl-CoA thioester hydrolase